jgi:AcrR family transcriptional regulator
MPHRRLTREESQQQTRSDLLAAAARVFARRGYDRASVAEIARAAGYSHGAVYSNFADKEDLFLALYEERVAGHVGAMDVAHSETDSVVEEARTGVRDWLGRLADDPETFLLRLEFTARAARDPRLRRRLGDRVGAVPLAISRRIERAAAAEGIELALAAEHVALGVQALSLGLALEALANPGGVSPAVGGELAARLLAGLRVDMEAERS